MFGLIKKYYIVLVKKGLIIDLGLFILGEVINILTGNEIENKSKELTLTLISQKQRDKSVGERPKIWSTCRRLKYKKN